MSVKRGVRVEVGAADGVGVEVGAGDGVGIGVGVGSRSGTIFFFKNIFFFLLKILFKG